MNSLTRFRSFSELNPMQREMNDLLERFFGRPLELEPATASTWMPAANISETPENVVLTAEIPGIDPKNLDISVTGDLLTLKGEKKQEQEEKNESFHRVERSFGTFTRSFRLPAAVVLDKIAADYKNGILRVTMPKTDDSRRKEVKIKVG